MATAGGIAKGLMGNDPVLGPIREIYTRRVAKFEARDVGGALKTLDSGVAYRTEHGAVGSEMEELVLLTNFIAEQPAARNELDWVRRHLKTEMPLTEPPTPARKAAGERA